MDKPTKKEMQALESAAIVISCAIGAAFLIVIAVIVERICQ